MQNNTKITDAIVKIVELEGEAIFKNSKKFIALLNDLIPECINERRVFQRALSNEILALFLPIYNNTISDPTNELMRIAKRMETELVLSEKHCVSVVSSFSIALGWQIPSQFNSDSDPTSEQPLATTKNEHRQKGNNRTTSNSRKSTNTTKNSVAECFKKDEVACTQEISDKQELKKKLEDSLVTSVQQRAENNKAFKKMEMLCLAVFGSWGIMLLSLLLLSVNPAFGGLITMSVIAVCVLDAIIYWKEEQEFSWGVIGLTFVTIGVLGVIRAGKIYLPFKNEEYRQKQTENQVKRTLNDTAERIEYLQDRIEILDEYCKKIEGCASIAEAQQEGVYATAMLSINKTEKSYLNAAKLFESIKGYKDADKQVEECLRKANEIHENNNLLYLLSEELCNSEKLKQDIKQHQQDLKLKDIKNISVIIQRLKVEKKLFTLKKKIRSTPDGIKAYLSSRNVGDTVSLGHFPQRRISSARFKFSFSPIKWKVLDKQEDRILITSEKSLLRSAFSQKQNPWAGSLIQTLLNGHFLDTAFTDEEYRCILPVENLASDEMNKNIYSEDSVDKCFCLSVPEVQKYLPEREDLYAAPSAWLKPQKEDSIMERWWTRTTGDAMNNAIAIICTEPNLHQDPLKFCDKKATSICVRPAMWVNIEL